MDITKPDQEDLLRHLKLLKVEKSRADERLADLWRKRRSLEQQHERKMGENATLKEVVERKKAAVNHKKNLLEEHHVEESKLQAVVDERKSWIDGLDKEMENMKKFHEKEVMDFEEKMSELIEWFRWARQYYADDNLEPLILENEKIFEQLEQDLSEQREMLCKQREKEREEICKQKELEQESEAATGFLVDDQKQILAIFEADKESSAARLTAAMERHAKLRKELDEIIKEVAILREKYGKGVLCETDGNKESQMDTSDHSN